MAEILALCNSDNRNSIDPYILLNAIGLWEYKNMLRKVYSELDKEKLGKLSKDKIDEGLNAVNHKMTQNAYK